MFAAFEYMLMSILDLARAHAKLRSLRGPWGLAGAYALFGFFALTMMPHGADDAGSPQRRRDVRRVRRTAPAARRRAMHETRDAVVLGVALGIGALAKSFMVPWAVGVPRRARGRHAVGAAFERVADRGRRVGWSSSLRGRRCSRVSAGRFTFGDTGRLTYAWFVNDQDAPSLGGVPLGRAHRGDRGDSSRASARPAYAPGTDPMWFDPARWNAMHRAALESARSSSDTLTTFQLFYVQSLAPLLFLILLIAVAPRGTRRDAWWSGWVVLRAGGRRDRRVRDGARDGALRHAVRARGDARCCSRRCRVRAACCRCARCSASPSRSGSNRRARARCPGSPLVAVDRRRR